MSSPSPGRAKKILFSLVLLLGLPLVTLAGIEGASSLLLLGRDLARARGLSEWRHTEYDSLLGWIHRPDTHIADIYGPGKHLRTNAQRIRADGPTKSQRPNGRFRVVCVGDSFTLGFGVSDESTWCHLLAADSPVLETVNMGQAGYGIDQAFLWYRRDGLQFEHDALLFSFITDDFRRVARRSFEGQPKPLLRVRNGNLVMENVPVPRSFTAGWRARYGPSLRSLRTNELILRLRMGSGRRPPDLLTDSAGVIAAVADRIVRELASLASSEGRLVALVYLPSPGDYQLDHSRGWRDRMAASAASAGVHFFDLVEGLRELPPEVAESFYALGHFNESGNAWVAETLRRHLQDLTAFPGGHAALPGGGRAHDSEPAGAITRTFQ